MLDLGMPGLDGVEVIEAIRGWSSVPILVVSGRTGAGDKVDALDAGADDYVTKPFSIEELLARLARAHPAPPAARAEPVVAFGDVTVDLAAHSVVRSVDGEQRQVRLTPTEWQVLELLLRNPGRLVTRQTMPHRDLGDLARHRHRLSPALPRRSCARSSSRIRALLATCSRRPGWGTGCSSTVDAERPLGLALGAALAAELALAADLAVGAAGAAHRARDVRPVRGALLLPLERLAELRFASSADSVGFAPSLLMAASLGEGGCAPPIVQFRG